jgi:hypothetical protein
MLGGISGGDGVVGWEDFVVVIGDGRLRQVHRNCVKAPDPAVARCRSLRKRSSNESSVASVRCLVSYRARESKERGVVAAAECEAPGADARAGRDKSKYNNTRSLELAVGLLLVLLPLLFE